MRVELYGCRGNYQSHSVTNSLLYLVHALSSFNKSGLEFHWSFSSELLIDGLIQVLGLQYFSTQDVSIPKIKTISRQTTYSYSSIVKFYYQELSNKGLLRVYIFFIYSIGWFIDWLIDLICCTNLQKLQSLLKTAQY